MITSLITSMLKSRLTQRKERFSRLFRSQMSTSTTSTKLALWKTVEWQPAAEQTVAIQKLVSLELAHGVLYIVIFRCRPSKTCSTS